MTVFLCSLADTCTQFVDFWYGQGSASTFLLFGD